MTCGSWDAACALRASAVRHTYASRRRDWNLTGTISGGTHAPPMPRSALEAKRAMQWGMIDGGGGGDDDGGGSKMQARRHAVLF